MPPPGMAGAESFFGASAIVASVVIRRPAAAAASWGAVRTTVAGSTRSTTLRTGDLPGSLADVRGIVTDGKGNLYVTSGNAVVKIRLP